MTPTKLRIPKLLVWSVLGAGLACSSSSTEPCNNCGDASPRDAGADAPGDALAEVREPEAAAEDQSAPEASIEDQNAPESPQPLSDGAA